MALRANFAELGCQAGLLSKVQASEISQRAPVSPLQKLRGAGRGGRGCLHW